jgi:hypothetical protein
MKRTLVYAVGTLLLSIGIAKAANPPELKEGLWSTHTQSIDNPGNKKTESTYTICRNHAYDEYVRSLTKGTKRGCTMVSESLEGGKYSVEMNCKTAGTVVHTKGTTTYQGDTATHSETRATYAPALAGISEMVATMDQKYVGSCPTGTQPGDMTSSDGTVNHLWKH